MFTHQDTKQKAPTSRDEYLHVRKNGYEYSAKPSKVDPKIYFESYHSLKAWRIRHLQSANISYFKSKDQKLALIQARMNSLRIDLSAIYSYESMKYVLKNLHVKNLVLSTPTFIQNEDLLFVISKIASRIQIIRADIGQFKYYQDELTPSKYQYFLSKISSLEIHEAEYQQLITSDLLLRQAINLKYLSYSPKENIPGKDSLYISMFNQLQQIQNLNFISISISPNQRPQMRALCQFFHKFKKNQFQQSKINLELQLQNGSFLDTTEFISALKATKSQISKLKIYLLESTSFGVEQQCYDLFDTLYDFSFNGNIHVYYQDINLKTLNRMKENQQNDKIKENNSSALKPMRLSSIIDLINKNTKNIKYKSILPILHDEMDIIDACFLIKTIQYHKQQIIKTFSQIKFVKMIINHKKRDSIVANKVLTNFLLLLQNIDRLSIDISISDMGNNDLDLLAYDLRKFNDQIKSYECKISSSFYDDTEASSNFTTLGMNFPNLKRLKLYFDLHSNLSQVTGVISAYTQLEYLEIGYARSKDFLHLHRYLSEILDANQNLEFLKINFTSLSQSQILTIIKQCIKHSNNIILQICTQQIEDEVDSIFKYLLNIEKSQSERIYLQLGNILCSELNPIKEKVDSIVKKNQNPNQILYKLSSKVLSQSEIIPILFPKQFLFKTKNLQSSFTQDTKDKKKCETILLHDTTSEVLNLSSNHKQILDGFSYKAAKYAIENCDKSLITTVSNTAISSFQEKRNFSEILVGISIQKELINQNLFQFETVSVHTYSKEYNVSILGFYCLDEYFKNSYVQVLGNKIKNFNLFLSNLDYFPYGNIDQEKICEQLLIYLKCTYLGDILTKLPILTNKMIKLAKNDSSKFIVEINSLQVTDYSKDTIEQFEKLYQEYQISINQIIYSDDDSSNKDNQSFKEVMQGLFSEAKITVDPELRNKMKQRDEEQQQNSYNAFKSMFGDEISWKQSKLSNGNKIVQQFNKSSNQEVNSCSKPGNLFPNLENSNQEKRLFQNNSNQLFKNLEGNLFKSPQCGNSDISLLNDKKDSTQE